MKGNNRTIFCAAKIQFIVGMYWAGESGEALISSKRGVRCLFSFWILLMSARQEARSKRIRTLLKLLGDVRAYRAAQGLRHQRKPNRSCRQLGYL